MARSKKAKTPAKARRAAAKSSPKASHHRPPLNQRVNFRRAHSPDLESSIFSSRNYNERLGNADGFPRHGSLRFVQSSDPDLARSKSTFESDPLDTSVWEGTEELSSHDDAAEDGTFIAEQRHRVDKSPRRRSLPMRSHSEDDVVVFKGRNKASSLFKDQARETYNVAPANLERKTPDTRMSATGDVGNGDLSGQQSHSFIPHNADGGLEPHRPRHIPKRNHKKMRTFIIEDAATLDEGLADYLNNVRATDGVGGPPLSFETYEGDTGVIEDMNPGGWRSSDLEDFGNLSTSDELLEAVQQILSKRVRPTGLQYLVVWAGQTVDEARWIPNSSLNMPGAAELIEAFEREEKTVEEYNHAADSSSDVLDDDRHEEELDVDEDDDGDDDPDDEFADERDLFERRAAPMTDERIAQLLAKQEELGLGSDELLLLDDVDSDDALGDHLERDVDFDDLPQPQRRKGQIKNGKLSLTYFAEGLEGEDYGDFDVMDFDRPSLVRAARRGGPDVSLNLSDDDLEESLKAAWAADRKKKKAKKQEREELRVQGLLGQRKKPTQLHHSKLDSGVDMDQLRETLEQFLMGTEDSCSLPPMDKRERKDVHEIAHSFGLKSSSTGKGRSRFPVLYKTHRTVDFDDDSFSRLYNRFASRLSSRKSQNDRGMGGQARRAVGGSGPGNVGYREGEIVGASAPEISSQNRGRAMLEKMGWSNGTALGSVENKGILQPLTQVMKKSRVGLG